MQTSRAAAFLVTGAVIGAAVVIIATFTMLVRPPRDPAALLGLALPASTSAIEIEVRDHGFGEYAGYMRFEIAPDDVATLLAAPGFQPVGGSDDPLTVFSNAARGNTPLVEIATRQPPAWWRPESSRRFTLAYRSAATLAEPAPDGAWYIVDTSDPHRATVYVYLLEL